MLTRVGDYVLERLVGQGAHGSVYEAYRRRGPRRRLALKLIESRGNLDTLLIEPEILSRLEHPGVLGLIDYFTYRSKVALVTEYVDGPSLDRLDPKQPIKSPQAVRRFLLEMASALAHAHSRKITHCDIKMSNILIRDPQRLRSYVLADFGVSRICEGVQLQQYIAGTVSHMAPEQIRGRALPQSDLWALGVVAYTLLTGSAPFEGRTREEMTRSILLSPLSKEELSRTGDPELNEIVLNLLEKDPLDRTWSAVELYESLDGGSYLPAPQNGSVELSRKPSPPSNRQVGRARLAWLIFWVLAMAAVLLDGCVGGLLTFAAAALLVSGYRRQSQIWIAASLVLLLPATILRGAYYGVFGWWAWIIHLPIYSLAFLWLAKARRLNREELLRTELRLAGGGEETLSVLRRFLDLNRGDIQLHQKYCEHLLDLGKVREAIVEARILLKSDPYNLSSALLLAQGYLEMGLPEECRSLCAEQLEVAPHCFEFRDLAERARLLEPL